MFKRFFHWIAHLLKWNGVRAGVYQYNYDRFVGVKCMGCGMVRKIDDNQYFHAEDVCFSSNHKSHVNAIIGCLEQKNEKKLRYGK